DTHVRSFTPRRASDLHDTTRSGGRPSAGGRTPLDQLVSPRLNEHESEGAMLLRQALALNPLGGGRRNALRAVRLLEQGAEADPDDPIDPSWCGVPYRS